MKRLYSALEIAEMRLPGLPTTKARVIDRATSEGWIFEEQSGRGGKRRMYELPEEYLRGTSHQAPVISDLAGALSVAEPRAPYGTAGGVAGAVAGGTVADPELLTLSIRAFEEWAEQRKIVIPPDRKAAIIAVLYNYLQKGAGQKEVDSLLKLVG